MKYDPNERPEGTGGPRTRIPAGRYKVTVTSAFESVDKWTKDKPEAEQAVCLDLEVTIATGPHQGRKMWAQYYTDGAVSPGRIKYGKLMIRRLCASLGIYHEWESDPVTGECHALRGKDGNCDIGPSSYKPEKDEITEWHEADRMAELKASAVSWDDTARRNGQIAAVVNNPRAAADFSGDVPF